MQSKFAAAVEELPSANYFQSARLDAGYCVLWRIRDPKTGDQTARVFGKREDGSIWYSDLTMATNFADDTEADRLSRAQKMMEDNPISGILP